jgi:hypothetical protein
MVTAIGVFHSAERAREAVRQLLDNNVPQDSMIFLTRSDKDAEVIGHEFNKDAVTGITGASIGAIAASTLLIPGIGGIVFGLGIGAATLLGLIGAESHKASDAEQAVREAGEDVDYFRNVLKEGYSVIMVRTESSETAQIAGDVLNRLGLSIQPR